MDEIYQNFSETSSVTLRSASSVSITPIDSWSTPQTENHTQPTLSENGKIKKSRRKGHTKSRTGCLNCKRARTKCKENRPSCDYCSHRGFTCEWPAIQISQARTMIRDPTPTSIFKPQSNPQVSTPVFNMHDFRYFYHFIQNTYPHQPAGNDAVWKHDIPALASDYDFLLHAMLALGAADLANPSNPHDNATELKDLTLAAITHRVKAIECLNLAVSNGITSLEQGNAMLAACVALLFQSILINDGLSEYMAFIRGCTAIGIHMVQKNWKIVFSRWQSDEQVALIGPGLSVAPLIDSKVAVSACRSLEKVALLCKSKLEIRALELLRGIARNLITSSRDAYMSRRQFYVRLMTATRSDFHLFTSPSQPICQVLLAHFVALQIVMTPISKLEWESQGRGNVTVTDSGMVKWLRPLHERVEREEGLGLDAGLGIKECYRWTMWVEKEAGSGRLYNGLYAEGKVPFVDE